MKHNNPPSIQHNNSATSSLSTSDTLTTNSHQNANNFENNTDLFQQGLSSSNPQKNQVSKTQWYPDRITRAVQFHTQKRQLTLKQYLTEIYKDSRKDLLLELEKFVNDVITSDGQPFTLRSSSGNQRIYMPNMLAKLYYSTLLEFIWLLSTLPPDYEYSEVINTLTRGCHDMNLMSLVDEPLHNLREWSSPKRHIIVDNSPPVAERFNALVQLIRHDWQINNCQFKLNQRKNESNRRYREYCEYVDALFEKYARLLVLRIDLSYDKCFTYSKTLNDMQQDLDRLFENKRHNSIFSEMAGHMLKIEFGIEKGIHCHLIIFLDGSKRNYSSSVHFAQEIGDYWNTTITRGQGAYWNVNNDESHYKNLGTLGIGVINHNDTDLRNNLRESVIKYLFKTKQCIKPKFGDKIKLLRRGDFPQIDDVKLGRPRKMVPNEPEE